MKEEIMNKLKDFTKEQGILFTSEKDAEEYYRGLVEIIEDLASNNMPQKHNWNLKDKDELLEFAWGIIANVSGGDWDKQIDDWKLSAETWRDGYHTPPQLRGKNK